ncbi:elongation of very long chain fatty acids protein AAEL008004-like isoform X1 [Varroa jacobsoni]|uniref:Elongation of very long chain fatty acids protein n=1 Tax=Varroa destructor TaxID=109461 RepID=A0A7M7KPB8_VARDE|nr:elongation of very long chain fatty acids protein AAEL008004-like isoform X1 [Varroa destructor]XP_022669917.1 elongation of very long chain fatty acids protein AAEL008004-like isoform X1 [Varroa destructor]XP_022669918.1 elongation of very long chain fatty acids protein AAEL008004-like isoform X1 [Varroa destructor]XP_022669919.1 elongation of very long chain fatty acids protein AAEL008004-like isoform X1 [Varroa destructor]XP_022669920.1 elongation of very long chain fatty acids protein AA
MLDSIYTFRQWAYEKADPRTRDWLLISNPIYVIVLEVAYLYFIYSYGPRMMANRKPYNLRNVINVYNVAMVIANCFFAYKFLRHSYLGGGYNLFCQPMNHSTDDNGIALVSYCYWYLLIRALDFLDTVFFVLRKRFDNITAQHVSHHALIVLNGYMFMYIGMDGQTMFGICMNCCIHVVMYIYYFLAMLGPRFKRHLWWKRYLTKAQIYQHVAIILHGFIPIFYDCGYPPGFIMIMMPQGFLGLALFINFYKLAYQKKSLNESINKNICIVKHD